MWPLLLAMVLITWQQKVINSLPKGIFAIALLQLPFVLQQYFVLVPRRIGLGGGIVPVDIVSGTFGASLFAGGANAVLAAFMTIVVACLLGLWKHSVLPAWKAVFLSLLLLSPLLLLLLSFVIGHGSF